MKVYVNMTYCVAWNGQEGFPPTSKRANQQRDEDPRNESSTLNYLTTFIDVVIYLPVKEEIKLAFMHTQGFITDHLQLPISRRDPI